MKGGLFCVLTQVLRSRGHFSIYRINKGVKLCVRRKPTLFTRRNLCKDVSLVENASRPVESPSPNHELQKQGVQKMKRPQGNIYDYVDRSPFLQNLIELGVEIYKFKDDHVLCKHLMKLNFDDIKPYLEFLYKNGVPLDKFGEYITKNPYIFQCDLDDLEVRINYLESKKFTKQMISHIITKHPKWLSYEVLYVDSQLGNVQTTLDLGGDEMRRLVYSFPGIVSVKDYLLRLNMFTFKEEFPISLRECQELILKEPRLLKTSNKDLIETSHFLIYNMNVPMHLVVSEPKVLLCRVHILRIRHNFLCRLGRAQYNPKQPGFVSLTNLVTYNDEEFCNKLAMTSLVNFYNFQKTL